MYTQTPVAVVSVKGDFFTHHLRYRDVDRTAALTDVFRANTRLDFNDFEAQAIAAAPPAITIQGIIQPISWEDGQEYAWWFGLHLLINGFHAVIAWPHQWDGPTRRSITVFADSAVRIESLNAYLLALTEILRVKIVPTE